MESRVAFFLHVCRASHCLPARLRSRTWRLSQGIRSFAGLRFRVARNGACQKNRAHTARALSLARTSRLRGGRRKTRSTKDESRCADGGSETERLGGAWVRLCHGQPDWFGPALP